MAITEKQIWTWAWLVAVAMLAVTIVRNWKIIDWDMAEAIFIAAIFALLLVAIIWALFDKENREKD